MYRLKGTRYLWVGLVACLMLVLAACGPAEAPADMAEPEAEEMADVADDGCPYNEAPMLADSGGPDWPASVDALRSKPCLGEGLAVNPVGWLSRFGDYGGEIIYSVVHVEMKDAVHHGHRDPKIRRAVSPRLGHAATTTRK